MNTMKKYILTTAIAFTTIALNAQNGATIEYKITSSKNTTGTVKVNYSEFGSISEFNVVIPQMPGGGMVMKHLTQKSNADVIYTLNDKTKTYSETKKQTADAEDTKTYTVKKLGDETVSGYKCAHALITEGTETSEVWNTKDVKDFEKYNESFKSNKRITTAKREKALKDAGCDGIPVKMVKKGNEREGDMTMELVKIDKKTFTKTDFDIPTGYTKNGESTANPSGGTAEIKTQQEIMKMTPEERAKYIEEMKKKYGKQ